MNRILGVLTTYSHTTQNYMYLQCYCWSTHFTVHHYTHTHVHTTVLSLHYLYPDSGFQHSNYTVSLNHTLQISHVKPSLHRLAFKPPQQNFLPSLHNHLWLPSQETPSIILPAGLGPLLYRLRADPTGNTISIFIAQQYLDCSLLICCCGNLFTESVPSSECLLWLPYSGFQASCHSILK
jgi:hypothetical protein